MSYPLRAHQLMLACMVFFPLCLLLGHFGDHDLSWTEQPLSTFAAQAPGDHWITLGMLLAALGLACASQLTERILWSAPGRVLGLLFSMAAGGLILLAAHEEVLQTWAQLQQSPPELAHQQGFHDAGLQLFYHATLLGLLLMALLGMLRGPRLRDRGLFLLSGLGALAAPLVMEGVLLDAGGGLRQRAAFACLWLSMTCLWLLAGDALRPLRGGAAAREEKG